MDINLLKESNVELCENLYALSTTYLKNNQSIELNYLLDYLSKLENNIRKCNDIKSLKEYINELHFLSERIEVIINE